MPTGGNAFLSFANFLKTELAGVLNVYIERQDNYTLPYLLLSVLSEDLKNNWLSETRIQGWLVCQKETNKPLPVTAETLIHTVILKSTDEGLLAKYNYGDSTKTQTGLMSVKLETRTGDQSSDPLRASHVIRWTVSSSRAS